MKDCNDILLFQLPITSSEQSLLQQAFSSFSSSPTHLQQQQSQTPVSVSPSHQSDIQQNQNLAANPLLNRHINKQMNLQQALSNATAMDNSDDINDREACEQFQLDGARNECTEQAAPNEAILQLVAQIPNHPLQKMAQRLISEPKISSDGKNGTTGSPGKNSKTSSNSECSYSLKQNK